MQTKATRLTKLPPYLFVEIDRKKARARAEGKDVIDFGVGDPDRPTMGFIIDAMAEAIRDPSTHCYPKGRGMDEFRSTAASYFSRRYKVEIDPGSEVTALIGSKEGIGHLPTALVNPDDIVLIPEPGYPVYTSASIFAGARPYPMPLREEHGWLPDFDEIPDDVRDRATLMFLNYPNNPTAACADGEFFTRAIAFARKHDMIIAHDCAYSEVYFEEPPPSILQFEGARECAIEFHSLSKTFNMTGWRIAFAVGHPDVLASLAATKDNLDSGPFSAVQHAAVIALKGYDHPDVKEQVEVYRQRRNLLCQGLREAGWPVTAPSATFFAWFKCPHGLDSMTVATRVLEEASVVVVPGAGFGKTANSFVRLAMTVEVDRTQEAIERISKIAW
ncbi:MAG: LL-diaminopimelate aminotransferase [Planctomycetota bacterium]|jgi:LL-diaminopimelate aminotransferase